MPARRRLLPQCQWNLRHGILLQRYCDNKRDRIPGVPSPFCQFHVNHVAAAGISVVVAAFACFWNTPVRSESALVMPLPLYPKKSDFATV